MKVGGVVDDADGEDVLNLHSGWGVFHALKRFSLFVEPLLSLSTRR